MNSDDLQEVYDACQALLLRAEPRPSDVRDLLSAFPPDVLSRALTYAADIDVDMVTTMGRAIVLMLNVSTADELTLSVAPMASAAVGHKSYALRKLGCQLFGQIITVSTVVEPAMNAARRLLKRMEDTDTGVATAAHAGLLHLRTREDALEVFLSPEGCLTEVNTLTATAGSVARARTFALLIDLAATPGAADLILASGVLEPLADELSNREDWLACMAAVEQICELAENANMPAAVSIKLAGKLNELVAAEGSSMVGLMALQGIGRLLPRCLPQGAELLEYFLDKVAELVQPEKEAPTDTVWDALGRCVVHQSCREEVFRRPGLLARLCEDSLGRGVAPALRIAALHALATCAGAEAVPAQGEQSIVLDASAEAELKAAAHKAAFPDSTVRIDPAQCLFEIMQQPFENLKVPAYRLSSALSARQWFASELIQNAPLLEFVLDPRSDAASMCKWKYGVVLVLAVTVQQAAERKASGNATHTESALAAHAERILEAKSKGPYGTGTDVPDYEPQVAVASRTS